MNHEIKPEWLSDELREAVGNSRVLFGIFGLGMLLFAGSIGVGLFHGMGERSGLPFGALAYQRVAREYAEAGNSYGAEREYRAEQRINKLNSGVVLQLARTLRGAGRDIEALRTLREAAENSLDSSLHVELARALAAIGSRAEAEQVLRRAIVFEPGYPLLHTRLGNFLVSHGDLDGAIVAFEEALLLNPEAVGAIDGLERLYTRAPHLRAQRSKTRREGP